VHSTNAKTARVRMEETLTPKGMSASSPSPWWNPAPSSGRMALTGQQMEGAYAQAMQPSVISTMAREDLERLVLEKPEVGLKIM
jgi:hypothetical protein